MKIAVVGKGGSGKTTTSAVVARALGRRGIRVVALDCDTNPNLGLSLGVGDRETERLVSVRERVDAGEAEHASNWEDILDRYGTDAPDGVRLSVITRIENPDPGCPCCGLSAEQLLGSVPDDDVIVIADFEAGIGTLTRLEESTIDVTLVVVEPTPRSIDVGRRAVTIADDQHQGRLIVVANKVSDADDHDRLGRAFDGHEIVFIPTDGAVDDADRNGSSPFDTAVGAPAVAAISRLAEMLVPVG